MKHLVSRAKVGLAVPVAAIAITLASAGAAQASPTTEAHTAAKSSVTAISGQAGVTDGWWWWWCYCCPRWPW